VFSWSIESGNQVKSPNCRHLPQGGTCCQGCFLLFVHERIQRGCQRGQRKRDRVYSTRKIARCLGVTAELE